VQRDIYLDGVLSLRYDDDARIVTDYRTDPPTSRPYSARENAETDGVLRDEAEAATERTIEDALASALAGMQAIIDTPNATLNAGPAPYIKDLARVNRRLIRLATRRLDGTA
jgi:hypothetical protein